MTLKKQAIRPMDKPSSQSSVSLKLAEIQKRCRELMDDTCEELHLTLDESHSGNADEDRYNLKR